jgi:hypothetical protein
MTVKGELQGIRKERLDGTKYLNCPQNIRRNSITKSEAQNSFHLYAYVSHTFLYYSSLSVPSFFVHFLHCVYRSLDAETHDLASRRFKFLLKADCWEKFRWFRILRFSTNTFHTFSLRSTLSARVSYFLNVLIDHTLQGAETAKSV